MAELNRTRSPETERSHIAFTGREADSELLDLVFDEIERIFFVAG